MVFKRSRQPVRSGRESRIVTAVASAYDIGAVIAPPVRQGGAINHVLRLDTDHGSVIVRMHRPKTEPELLAAVHRIQDVLRAEGLPVPSIWRTRDGKSSVRLDDRLVEVTSFVPGGHEVQTWDDAAVLFRHLGRFHAIIRNVDGRGVPPPVHACYATPGTALDFMDTAEPAFRAGIHDPEYPLAAEARTSTRQLLHRLQAVRPTYETVVPQILIHGDFVGYNVLIKGDEVIALLDFDRLALRHRVFDVAYSLMYVLTQLVRTGGRVPEPDHGLTSADLAAVPHLLANYSAASQWQLSGAEMRALPFEMARCPLYPIVTAWLQPEDAVAETLRFASNLPLACWLVDHAATVAAVTRKT